MLCFYRFDPIHRLSFRGARSCARARKSIATGRGYGFRARGLEAHAPGMTATESSQVPTSAGAERPIAPVR